MGVSGIGATGGGSDDWVGDDFDGGTMSDINVTPLVDVMLVLLVIFMVAAPMLQQGVELELPQETIAPLPTKEETVVVSLDKSGKIFLGEGAEVGLDSVGKKVKAIIAELAAGKETTVGSVLIRADKSVAYGEVMAVLGRLRRSGIENVGLVTEPSG